MKSGTVKLLDSDENIIFQNQYKSCDQWKRIVVSWMELYGDHFYKYHVQFAPDVKVAPLPAAIENQAIIPKIKKKTSDYKYVPLSRREKGNIAFYG